MRTALLLLPLFACADVRTPDTGDGLPVACEDIAIASVQVRTTDLAGDPLPVHEVTWSVDGGPTEQAQCVSASGAPPCEEWIAAWEVAGDIEITAVFLGEAVDACCTHYDEAVTTVTVGKTADDCHVVTEEVRIALDPTAQLCLDTACR